MGTFFWLLLFLREYLECALLSKSKVLRVFRFIGSLTLKRVFTTCRFFRGRPRFLCKPTAITHSNRKAVRIQYTPAIDKKYKLLDEEH